MWPKRVGRVRFQPSRAHGTVPLLLTALALAASAANAQHNLRVTDTQERSITVAWDGNPNTQTDVLVDLDQTAPTEINGFGFALCIVGPAHNTRDHCPSEWVAWSDRNGSVTVQPGRTYRLTVTFSGDTPGSLSVTATAAGELIEDEDDNGEDGGNGGDGGGPPAGGGGGGGPPPPDDDDQDDEPPPPPGPPEAGMAVDAACADGLCRARAGVAVRFDDASAGLVRFRRWDFGDGTERTSRAVSHSWSEPGFYTVTLRVGDGETESTASRLFLVEASDPAGTCEASARTRCLLDSRFSVEVEWRTAEGASGAGGAVREGTNDSALFHFFESGNWEILVKVLDGCALNGHVWVFGASATTLGWELRVTDTVTGAERVYGAEPGERAPAVTDARAFPESCEG